MALSVSDSFKLRLLLLRLLLDFGFPSYTTTSWNSIAGKGESVRIEPSRLRGGIDDRFLEWNDLLDHHHHHHHHGQSTTTTTTATTATTTKSAAVVSAKQTHVPATIFLASLHIATLEAQNPSFNVFRNIDGRILRISNFEMFSRDMHTRNQTALTSEKNYINYWPILPGCFKQRS